MEMILKHAIYTYFNQTLPNKCKNVNKIMSKIQFLAVENLVALVATS